MNEKKCPVCGADLKDSHRFCPQCGAKVPPQAEPPKAPPVKPEPPKANPPKSTPPKKKQTGKRSSKKSSPQTFIFLGIIGVLAIILIAVVIFLLQGDSPSEPAGSPSETMEHVSAEAYYNETARVISVTPVQPSNSSTYMEASRNMEARGLNRNALEGLYSMGGQALVEEEQMASQAQSPTYRTFFSGDDDSLWEIFEIGGQVMAYPISYVADHNWEKSIIVSEKESLMSYDSETNCFYETVPDPRYVLVIVVPEISAQSLSNLTAEVLDGYAN